MREFLTERAIGRIVLDRGMVAGIAKALGCCARCMITAQRNSRRWRPVNVDMGLDDKELNGEREQCKKNDQRIAPAILARDISARACASQSPS